MHHYLNEICGNCGHRFGLHLAGYYELKKWLKGLCPGPEAEDKLRLGKWENSPGTTFKPTGKYEKGVMTS